MNQTLNNHETVRAEYPRPDFQRKTWLNLNGLWDFEFDDAQAGEGQKWYREHKFGREILVPFCYQSELSGIQDTGYHPYVWYHRTFALDSVEEGKRYLLKFGAVDYHSKVWINGEYVGEHFGGHISFEFEITHYVHPGANEIVLLAEDTFSCEIPRGKQIWGEKPERCWYTATTGIWQSVWIEVTGNSYFKSLHVLPDIDKKSVEIHANWIGKGIKTISCAMYFAGKRLALSICQQQAGRAEFTFLIPEQDPIEEFHYWSPENPQLYDFEMVIEDENGHQDEVSSYFGMRKISVQNGQIYLNNKPYFQKLVLDQGYWPDGLMTAPDDACFQHDIRLVKAMGFNGVRKHQKIEDPRFHYWADRLGILVWEEMPSTYEFSSQSIGNTAHEWMDIVRRDRNHPCVVTWVTLNESWGVRNIVSSRQQQDYAAALYYLTKSLNPGCLVSSNDGWEQIQNSDLCSVHDYFVTADDLVKKYSDLDILLRQDAQGRALYAYGHQWQQQPVILSEFGGMATISEDANSWGYNGKKITASELLDHYKLFIEAIKKVNVLQGFCYTQFTDVMQEANGLLHADHSPKVPLEKLHEVNQIF